MIPLTLGDKDCYRNNRMFPAKAGNYFKKPSKPTTQKYCNCKIARACKLYFPGIWNTIKTMGLPVFKSKEPKNHRF